MAAVLGCSYDQFSTPPGTESGEEKPVSVVPGRNFKVAAVTVVVAAVAVLTVGVYVRNSGIAGQHANVRGSNVVGLATALPELGDRALLSFGMFNPTPLTATAAEKVGWKKISSCVPGMGFQWANGSLSQKTPYSVYFSAAGQFSGFATDVFFKPADKLVEKGYWMPVKEGEQYTVKIGTRPGGDQLCDDTYKTQGVIGTQAVIHPDGIKFEVPMTKQGAAESDWVEGAYYQQMGIHYGYDHETPGTLTFQPENLVPVMPMYSRTNDVLATVLFTSPSAEHDKGAMGWDPLVVPSFLMCGNFCDAKCMKGENFYTHKFSTQHWYFTDSPGGAQTQEVDDWKCGKTKDEGGPFPFPGLACCKHYQNVFEETP